MKNILFSFVRCPEKRLDEVRKGAAPKESLLGYYHLSSTSSNVRHLNHLKSYPLQTKLMRFYENIKHLLWSDIVVNATRLSLVFPFLCRLLGKKVVFYDAFQRLPNHPLKRKYFRLCMKVSSICIFYSKNQLEVWQQQYPSLIGKGKSIVYGIDSGFFSTSEEVRNRPIDKRQHYLSVGRDPSRDFSTLADAFHGSYRRLILVTQDYMLSDKLRANRNIRILSDLSYTELSELYDASKAAIIPILDGTSHLSGIRAAMEAMAKFVPVIMTQNGSLAEYFKDNQHVMFFEAENVDSLQKKISELEAEGNFHQLAWNANQLVTAEYSYKTMCKQLLEAINAR